MKFFIPVHGFTFTASRSEYHDPELGSLHYSFCPSVSVEFLALWPGLIAGAFHQGPANTWKGRTRLDRLLSAEESAHVIRNRSGAGQRLAVALARYKEQEPAILALPRGGVAVAAEVAAALHLILDQGFAQEAIAS